ncbi:hypothetical protein C0Q70_07058 [Pomacea canaliculata]|uniref:Uncharacterized protein n=1 Tax=Pomacea canaliculata TaxID=400727 RepID=A0A2T7PDZ8_POMCA|nr:hypothetical protein C0Q70_07058 [Pomacea canaliculata]
MALATRRHFRGDGRLPVTDSSAPHLQPVSPRRQQEPALAEGRVNGVGADVPIDSPATPAPLSPGRERERKSEPQRPRAPSSDRRHAKRGGNAESNQCEAGESKTRS